MRALKRNIPITAAVFASVAAMAVAAVAQSGESSPGEGTPQITSIEADAKQAMDVLDTARTSSDAMPSAVAASIDEDAKFGMNPDLSRESIETISASVYIIPADDHVCSGLTLGGGVANLSCAETSDIAAGEVGPTATTLAAGGIGIYGVVPDDVLSVTLNTGTTTSTTVPVDENAYFTAVPEGTVLRSLSYTGPSGVVEFPLHDPALIAQE